MKRIKIRRMRKQCVTGVLYLRPSHERLGTRLHERQHVLRQERKNNDDDDNVRWLLFINSRRKKGRVVKCDRIWENQVCRDSCAIILIFIFVVLVITLHNSYLLSYGEINLILCLYGLISLQKADIFERS